MGDERMEFVKMNVGGGEKNTWTTYSRGKDPFH